MYDTMVFPHCDVIMPCVTQWPFPHNDMTMPCVTQWPFPYSDLVMPSVTQWPFPHSDLIMPCVTQWPFPHSDLITPCVTRLQITRSSSSSPWWQLCWEWWGQPGSSVPCFSTHLRSTRQTSGLQFVFLELPSFPACLFVGRTLTL